jgi:hypothetical protein
MDTKRKTCDIRTRKNIYFSTNPPPTLIHLSNCFTSASKPAAQKSFHCCLRNFRTWSSIISDFRNVLEGISRPNCEPVYVTTLPTVNMKHFLMNILCIESFCTQEKHNRTVFFGSTLFNHGRQFDWRNQSLNMRMRVCYLDCHGADLCCYLVIHIENLLLPLQLFYFYLWPVYWLSLVLGGNLPQCLFVHHKTHMTWLWMEPGPPRWEAWDSWHSQGLCLSSKSRRLTCLIRTSRYYRVLTMVYNTQRYWGFRTLSIVRIFPK